MKLHIFFFEICVILKLSFCYDLEIEGTVKLTEDFIKEILNNNSIPKSGKTQVRRQMNGQDEPTQIEPKISNDEKFVITMGEHLIISGVQQLRNFIKYLSYKCNVKTEGNVIIRTAISDYMATVKQKAKELGKNFLSLNDVDQEYTLLNLVEISSVMFYRQEKVILNEMETLDNKTIFELNINALLDKVSLNYKEHKTKGMQIICKHYMKCREYPGFSDQIGDVIVESLKLPSTKLLSFLDILKKLLLKEVKFIGKLIEPKVLDEIIKNLKQGFEYSKIKNNLEVLNTIVASRYKIIKNSNETAVKRTKAARILLDIFDKSFYIDGQDLLFIEFHTTIQSMKEWSLDRKSKSDLEENLSNLLQHILRVLKYQWEDGVVDEINTLIEIIFLGRASNDFCETYLLNKGSFFVNNKFLHSNAEVGQPDFGV